MCSIGERDKLALLPSFLYVIIIIIIIIIIIDFISRGSHLATTSLP